jgi:hypothetical protein
LEENLGRLPESVPVILYCLDNSCFKAMNRNGDLLSFTKSKKDHLYHVVGDLVVTPFSLLSVTLDELERVIAACGNRRIFILSVLPRYFLKPCCEDVSHCANVCRHDETAVEAARSCSPTSRPSTSSWPLWTCSPASSTAGWATWWTACTTAGGMTPSMATKAPT